MPIKNEDLFYEVWDALVFYRNKGMSDLKSVAEVAKSFTLNKKDVMDVLDAIRRSKESKLEKLKIAQGKPQNMPGSLKNKLNQKIHDLLEPTYFKHIPLEQLFNILKSHKVIPLQEDMTEWGGFMTGKDGRAMLELAPHESQYGDPEFPFYVPYKNVALVVTWHKMSESGNYEVIAYIS